jgi:hypothetical protein
METWLIIAIVGGVIFLLIALSLGIYFLTRKKKTVNGGGDGNDIPGPIATVPVTKPLPGPVSMIAIPNSPGARTCPKTANNFIVPGLIPPWKGEPIPLVLSNYKFAGDTPYVFSNGTFYFREAYTGDNC